VLKKLVSICIIGTFFSASAFAQEQESGRYDRALAAGYKAQFICSGLWNGGKSLADIKADELTGIYERIADIVPTLTEEVDATHRQVSVRFAMMHPRASPSGIAKRAVPECRLVSPTQQTTKQQCRESFLTRRFGRWAMSMR